MIEFEISEQLKPIVSEFGYDKKGMIKITFTEIYQNISLHCLFNIKNISKSFADFEKRLKTKVDKLSSIHYNLIEDNIFNNLKKIDDVDIGNNDNNAVDDKGNSNLLGNRTIY